jgi:hypothetical protein
LHAPATAGVCEETEAEDVFAAQDPIAAGYFDVFMVRRRDDTFFIRASKNLNTAFSATVAALDGIARHAEFIPGYRRIEVRAAGNGAYFTAIRFRPDFWFRESRFTNRVEVVASASSYRQCWRQLAPDDPNVLEAFSGAPAVNYGYWRVLPAPGGVTLHYFSVIAPPVPLPTALYKHVTEYSYRDLFEKVAARAARRPD